MTNLEFEADKQELEKAIKKFARKYDLLPVIKEWSQWDNHMEISYRSK